MVDREYWLRLDGRNMKMKHYQIRDMMSRHDVPDLRMLVTARPSGTAGSDVTLVFSLLNTGIAIAKHAGWHVEFGNARIMSASGCSDLSHLNDGKPFACWGQNSGAVIHPIRMSAQTGRVG